MRSPFPGNRIPTNRVAPIAGVMKSVSAQPNLPGNPWLEPTFQTYYPLTGDNDTYTFKGDHVFSEKDNISARYTDAKRPFKRLGGRYGFPPPGATNTGGTGLQDTTIRSAFARWNHVFSPTLFNEFQASANRSKNHTGTLADTTNWADKLGLPESVRNHGLAYHLHGQPVSLLRLLGLPTTPRIRI